MRKRILCMYVFSRHLLQYGEQSSATLYRENIQQTWAEPDATRTRVTNSTSFTTRIPNKKMESHLLLEFNTILANRRHKVSYRVRLNKWSRSKHGYFLITCFIQICRN